MNFPPQFLDEIRARAPLADIVGRRVRLIRRGREHVALCPFHKEKSPSFTVVEDKGFFHCFGCGAHGDVIGFVMRIDSLSFLDAVERLAGAAGLPLPERTPEDRELSKERTSLYGVLEAACAWFEAQLAGVGGKTAREYLAGRSLDADTIAAFRLGWAPSERYALERGLAGHGVSKTMRDAAGLVITPEDGGAPYDRFRGRIIFPITDRSGRVVAFGGRSLGEGRPKYLNSPETSLFHKGALLYGLAQARKPAREAGEVIVAEGYMDVIALARADFPYAVAPLGTALTDIQIRELWRLAPEPVVCFDGDAAGQSAAHRVAERVLPLLQPGKSLRFAVLPAGDDPDSFIARRGVAALREVLAASRPLADILWEIEVGGRAVDTPERRAAVQKRLDDFGKRIQDPTVRRYYNDQFRDRLWNMFNARRPAQRRRGRAGTRGIEPFRAPERQLPDSLGAGSDGVSERRERHLVTMIINRPELLGAVEEEFAALEIAGAEAESLRRAILDVAHESPGLDSETLKRHLSAQGFSDAVENMSAPRAWSERRLDDGVGRSAAPLPELVKEWRHVLAVQHRAVTLPAELEEAEAELARSTTVETRDQLEAMHGMIAASPGDEADLDEPYQASEGDEAA